MPLTAEQAALLNSLLNRKGFIINNVSRLTNCTNLQLLQVLSQCDYTALEPILSGLRADAIEALNDTADNLTTQINEIIANASND